LTSACADLRAAKVGKASKRGIFEEGDGGERCYATLNKFFKEFGAAYYPTPSPTPIQHPWHYDSDAGCCRVSKPFDGSAYKGVVSEQQQWFLNISKSTSALDN